MDRVEWNLGEFLDVCGVKVLGEVWAVFPIGKE